MPICFVSISDSDVGTGWQNLLIIGTQDWKNNYFVQEGMLLLLLT